MTGPGDLQPLQARLDAALLEAQGLRRELARTRAELEDFTYSVSHDLRASLRHITSYAKILKEDLGVTADADIQSSLDAISHAASHQARLIDGLMGLARIGRVALQSAPVSLEDTLADVRATLEREMAHELASRTVQWQVDTPLPLVTGDAALVRLVLHQVLANALKFTRERAVAHIVINCTPPVAASDLPGHLLAGDGVLCQLHIRDNGVGYNPQYQDKLFRALSRLHSGASYEGIGMGLAMCRAAVKRLGGDIAASGQVDGGCTVIITLPCQSPGVAR